MFEDIGSLSKKTKTVLDQLTPSQEWLTLLIKRTGKNFNYLLKGCIATKQIDLFFKKKPDYLEVCKTKQISLF